MFEARLKEAKLLKSVLEALKKLAIKCNFDCNKSGIALQAMDSPHVALVTMKLCSDGFDSYRCDRNIRLGIDLTRLNRILKCARPTDITTLKANDNDDALSLIFEDKVVIECTEEDIKFSCKGKKSKCGMTSKAGGSVDCEDDSIEIELQSSVTIKLSVKYLVDVTKATPLSSRVSLNLSNERPLMVEYKIGNLGHVRFHLASLSGKE